MLDTFHPVVRAWFAGRFGDPTEPQSLAWPQIALRRDVLVSAPTGSGKTLAAFLSAIDGLLQDGLAGRLEDRTRVVYVSPLRALGNDIARNLEAPLAEIRAAALEAGLAPPELRVAVRTGDTTASARRSLLLRPPHLLVTTPESLYLLLTGERGRETLEGVETVIVDEIHALAGDRRGAHLALSLERLEALARRRPQRIGLSATVEPVAEVARFLVGAPRVGRTGRPRCSIVEVGRRRAFDLAIEVPRDELSSVASKELWAETYDRVAEIVRAHRSTLVFVGTRRLAERAAHALAERLGEGEVAAHHGSLSRTRRLAAEERLKAGALKAVVATASLELGIDVGDVDVVVQLGSPGALATGLQRIGRAAHVKGGTPKGRLFPMSRDELVECAALVRGLRRARLEPVAVRDAPLDVLAQQVVAEAACGAIHEDRLFELCRRAWPYRALAREDFDAVVQMLSEGIATSRGRASALLHRDGVNRRVTGRRGARIAALTGGGTIPDTAQYAVVAEPEGAVVGQLDEDFAVESIAGDIFLLGTTSWRIRRVEAGVVRVEDAHGAPPGVPFWNGEAPGRSGALSAEVSALREELEPRLADPAAAAAWLEAEAALPAAGARQVVEYLAAGRAMLGALPTQHTLVAERFFDEAGGMQLVVHAPLGARTNRALGLALRKRFCRTFDFELQAAATDEGVLLSLGPQHAFPLESIFSYVTPATLDEVLTQAVLQAPMFGVRWRWNATRALAIPRLFKGKRMPPPIARMRADDLLSAVFPAQTACQDNAPGGPIEVPDHPLVRETLRDCLGEAMDAGALRGVLERIAAGEIRLVAVDTPEPSPLAHELLNARPWAYLDDAPLEERRARAVAVRRALPPAEAAAAGALDPAAIEEVASQVWPAPRDADEVHDALLDLVLLPAGEAAAWAPWLDALAAAGRARTVTDGERTWWVATERLGALPLDSVNPLTLTRSTPLALDSAHPLTLSVGRNAAGVEGRAAPAPAPDPMLAVLRGWMTHLGPVTAARLAARTALPLAATEAALAALEAEGRVLRGTFLPGEPWSPDTPHWCERGVLARIHRLTIGRLRREIEPVSTAVFLRFLARWQHAAPGTRLHGTSGLLEVIGQLQGFHAAAGAWERDLLPARVQAYEPRLLDALCASGEVAWGRLHVAPPQDGLPPRRRGAPTRSAPVTLALREDLPWLLEATAAGAEPPPLGTIAAELVEVLARRGASFLGELAQAVRTEAGEAEEALWELVSGGRVACDGFAGLRALVSPPPGHRTRPAAAGGRWALLRAGPPAPGAEADALPEATLEPLARQYLRRYGVVFRDLLAREARPPPWRDLVRVYRTLEARGEIRGGRFVSGFSGEQFAAPEAVDALRATRREAAEDAPLEVCAADPLNLAGILTPGPRIPAAAGGRVVVGGALTTERAAS
ncbi:DEAD/H associated domain protein [Anaeromyxobacter dehalogenans 2CP-1]|uniref:DEAD/H associated domain protein n=1 Tax=Anaeromyxobacter dehalogenans (strain ATCC BAA-258 / DSM 21875 / 2CP-1) TaxID=455488 RepID=B8J8Q2_ANAD2|nr:DEAD/DEAH box helicase [Anaeromyxobacter dehalogenans]ACL67338.1 DEAD/H associated domain protein [Anaeromyxobacter dehalogenans 2CP-1]